MPLEKLTLKSFQCHEDLTLEFSPGVTTIVATNNTGKSATIRALRWLSFNQPNGDSFITYGKDSVEVAAVFDGKTITRAKGKKNLYKIDNAEYVSFGAGKVPEAISQFLNLSPVSFALQKSEDYFFSLSPGQVSKELNQIINLEVIDASLAYTATEVRRAKAELEVTQNRVEEARARKRSLLWVQGFDRKLRRIERKQARYGKQQGQVDELQRLLTEIRAVDRVTNQRTPNFDRLERFWNNARREEQRCQKLNSLLQELRGVTLKQRKLKNELKKAERRLRKAFRGKCPVCERPIERLPS